MGLSSPKPLPRCDRKAVGLRAAQGLLSTRHASVSAPGLATGQCQCLEQAPSTEWASTGVDDMPACHVPTTQSPTLTPTQGGTCTAIIVRVTGKETEAWGDQVMDSAPVLARGIHKAPTVRVRLCAPLTAPLGQPVYTMLSLYKALTPG